MRASVVIPVYNDAEGLASCLEALAAQDLPPSDFEIIVVDNGSASMPDIDPSHAVTLLHEPSPGSYTARNTGIEAATAPIIAFTDADCRPHRDWLRNGLAFFDSHPDIAMIGGRIDVIPADTSARTPAEVYQTEQAFPQQSYVEASGFAATANMMIRRDVLHAVGTFTDSLKSGGDAELGARVRSHGHAIAYVDGAVVDHTARRTTRELITKLARTMAGARDTARHRGGPYPWHLVDTVRDLVPPVRTTFVALRDRRIGSLRDRLGLVYVTTAMHYARWWYKTKLRFTTHSPR